MKEIIDGLDKDPIVFEFERKVKLAGGSFCKCVTPFGIIKITAYDSCGVERRNAGMKQLKIAVV